jgi:Ca2+-binding EF-hand superfamily protein
MVAGKMITVAPAWAEENQRPGKEAPAPGPAGQAKQPKKKSKKNKKNKKEKKEKKEKDKRDKHHHKQRDSRTERQHHRQHQRTRDGPGHKAVSKRGRHACGDHGEHREQNSAFSGLIDVRVQVAFDKYSTDISGTIDKTELKLALPAAMGHEYTITDERFEALCLSTNADGNATVDFDDFLHMLEVLKKENDKLLQKYDDDDEDWEARTSVFGFIPTVSRIAFDGVAGCIEGLSIVSADEETGVVTDLSGIEEDDLPQTLAALGFEVPAEIVLEAVVRIDEDESGTVEYEEFVALLTSLHQDGAFVTVSKDAELILADAQVADRTLKARAVAAAQREKESQELLAREKEIQYAKSEEKVKMKAHLERVKKANSKLKAGTPTRAEVAGLKIEAEFNKFDTDHGGTIDTSELGSAVGALGIETTPERLLEIVASVDADGSGTIDFAEFKDMLEVLKKDIGREAPAVVVVTASERVASRLEHDHHASKVLQKWKQSNPTDRIRRFMLKYTNGGKQYAERIVVEEQEQMQAERLRRLNEAAETDAKLAAETKAAATAKRRGNSDRAAKKHARDADTRKRHKIAKSLGRLVEQ